MRYNPKEFTHLKRRYMEAIVSKYGPSQKAYLVVPIVGAFLIDVFAMPIIITSINLFS